MAKRISSSSVKWDLIAKHVLDEGKGNFVLFKSKAEKYLRAVNEYPADLPKIDWNLYKSKISKPGFVESLQKAYESLKVPYPSDEGFLAKRDEDEAQSMKSADELHKKFTKECEELKVTLAKLEGMKKFSQMSLEEFMINKPEYRINTDNPRLFPQFIDTEPEYDERKPLPPPKLH